MPRLLLTPASLKAMRVVDPVALTVKLKLLQTVWVRPVPSPCSVSISLPFHQVWRMLSAGPVPGRAENSKESRYRSPLTVARSWWMPVEHVESSSVNCRPSKGVPAT